jgi:hypothetical protein
MKLLWFNKEGDALNINYDQTSDLYSGTLFFDQNSSDTYKTIGLYLFEKIDSFEFESIDGDLGLQKFQLFNENRFTFTGNSYFTQSITAIEPVNNRSDFYSKWIYGLDFEKKYHIGSCIVFDSPIFEFSDTNYTYIVVSTKKNAIMIISAMDNLTFTNTYVGLTFSNKSISGLNSVGIYDYRRDLNDQLSDWNEPTFYTKLYNDKRLTLVGSQSGVVTVKNKDLIDRVYYKYNIDTSSYTQSSNLSATLTLKTDLPTIYSGGLNILNNKVYFSEGVPKVLKPGIAFTIDNSTLNPYFITVNSIPFFISTITNTFYATQSQVMWNSLIYECLQAYSYTATSSITPDNVDYWTSSVSYVPSNANLVNETLLGSSVHLTTNKLYYVQSFTNSNAVTMATFVERFKSDFATFNLDLYYTKNKLNADLKLASNYASVDFYIGSSTQSITNIDRVVENCFATSEILTPLIDTNISSNYKYQIVITDIDDFGIKFTINGQVYNQSIQYVYSGNSIDLKKSIDRTLRDFLFLNYARLTSIGIDVTLESSIYTAEFDFYRDTIVFTSHFPNVPLNILVQIGTTANYYVKHSKIDFLDMGSYLNININGRDYGQRITSSTASTFEPDIETAVSNWVNTYKSNLAGYDILVYNIRSVLYFNTTEPSTRLNYTIKTNKLPTPGIEQYVITKYYSGSVGSLISGNQIVLSATSSQNFETYGFATGMITSINNSNYPYNNQEYNIIYLEPNQIGLSYQGPFWDTAGKECNVSAFTTLAFSPLAYTQSICTVFSATGTGGQFNSVEFDEGFRISYIATNDYDYSQINIGNTNCQDMLFVNVFDSIYVGGYNLSVVNASSFQLITTINLPYNNITKIVYNSYNNYLYLVTSTHIIVIDPTTNTVYKTIAVTTSDIVINQSNGDVYISNETNNYVYIYYYNSFNTPNKTLVITNANKMEYNLVDGYIYVIGDKVYYINTSTRTVSTTSYSIPTLSNQYIFSEPIYGSIYVWATASTLYKISEGLTSSISVNYNGDNEILYDNLSGNLFITQANLDFKKLTLSDNVEYTKSFGYGDIVIGQYDSDIYMATSIGFVYVIDPTTGYLKYTLTLGFGLSRIIYNSSRDSVIVLGINGQLVEIIVTLNSSITLSSTLTTPSKVSEGYFGSLSSDYVPKTDIWLKTREYIRAPRENFNGQGRVDLYYKFETDEHSQIFMYDISGNQLNSGTSYSYIGEKPLQNPYLNKIPNKDITKISDSSAQQTVFDEIMFTLDYVDSDTNISILPSPLELFLGYNDTQEGYVKTTLNLYKKEDVSFTLSYVSNLDNLITLSNYTISGITYSMIQLAINAQQSFIYDSNDIFRGLKIGQILQISVTDVTNITNKWISNNNGKQFKIKELYNNQIILNTIDDILLNETNIIQDYPENGSTTYLDIKFTVIDKTIAKFDVYGQTEIEDIRYRIELSNIGHLINPSDAYIFKTYDIDEGGIDWRFLNKKRKEMLMVKDQIFPYVGSYKSIINSINYFGYNDLDFYEYYRNIDINSPNFYKLFKVLIPDIFDNTVPGFKVNDFLRHTLPNPNYEDTNLFNLTYRITDKQGNWILKYSLQEVIIKLQGLKRWLETNVVPITHKILDITGAADFRNSNYIVHKSFSRKGYSVVENFTPVDFNINEAYLMPVNSGSTVYNVVIDFVTPKSVNYPTNFTVFIRTYKTYKEWNPFTTYSKDEEVIYYGIIYKSFIDDNRILDPRKYEDVSDWNPDTEYFNGNLANYNRHIYQYMGASSSFIEFGTQSTIYPSQTNKWLDISEWIIQDLKPVQSISEYRYIDSVTYSVSDNMDVLYYPQNYTKPDYLTISKPFNFSVDSNIDPFITVEVTSDNGYGMIYTSKKNYEIRGLNDLFAGVRSIEPIGPFTPIAPVTNSY